MGMRSHTTFQKRQKEMARAEKQREKAAKRAQKKDAERTPEAELTLEQAESLRLGSDAPALDAHQTSEAGERL